MNPEEIEKDIRNDDELIIKEPDNPYNHFKKAFDLINMSLAIEFPFDPDKLLKDRDKEYERIKEFNLEDSFLTRGIQEFDRAIDLEKGNLLYHQGKLQFLQKIAISFKLIERSYRFSQSGCVIGNLPEIKVIPDKLNNLVEQEIIKELSEIIDIDSSQEGKFEHIIQKIDFYSSHFGVESAIMQLNEYISKYPSNSRLYFKKAMILLNSLSSYSLISPKNSMDLYHQSLSECERAIENDSKNPSYHLLRGYLLKSIGRQEEGNNELEQANNSGKKDTLFKLDKIEIEGVFKDIEMNDSLDEEDGK
ncbi:tetratricopeptide repeat protein [Cuniculiplasma sp. SKW3]|uniref:tetratricopeptide repeat protein n=1 Tax=Cuniculiplasma sp. SKW3 TaxID=3400170 RepID=UPI003FCF91ED